MCGGEIHLIGFMTEGAQIRRILDSIGVDSEPPRVWQARGPPLWDDSDAQTDDGRQSLRTGIWRRNPHPMARLTSASTGY